MSWEVLNWVVGEEEKEILSSEGHLVLKPLEEEKILMVQ